MMRLVYISGKPDSELRECRDCDWCRKVSKNGEWWCMDAKAQWEFGTILPGRENCQFWSPIRAYSELGLFERILGDYIKIDLAGIRGGD